MRECKNPIAAGDFAWIFASNSSGTELLRKKNENRSPLIVKGTRQIGKTKAIEFFAENHYKSVIQMMWHEITI